MYGTRLLECMKCVSLHGSPFTDDLLAEKQSAVWKKSCLSTTRAAVLSDKACNSLQLGGQTFN